MAEHDDLDLLCVLGAKLQDDELNQAAKAPVKEGHDHEVARLRLLHRRRRLRHASEPPVPHRKGYHPHRFEFSAPTPSERSPNPEFAVFTVRRCKSFCQVHR